MTFLVASPDTLLEQMRSCHNAATEFLRQYWSSILPTAAGATDSTAKIKMGRASKMAQYLRSTEGKVNAVVHTATIAGVDPARVRAVSRTALAGLQATENRLRRWHRQWGLSISRWRESSEERMMERRNRI